MKAIILCAGYAVRLYPLTKDKPKPLLPVGGRPILDYLVQKLDAVGEIDTIYIVSNGKFASHFDNWAKHQQISRKVIRVINDKTQTNESRLGALGDMNLVIKSQSLKEDILVLAGDNYFTFDLQKFVIQALLHKPFASLGLYDVEDLNLAQNYGLVETENNGKITSFLEKPVDPQTTLASTGIYFFPQETLLFLDQFIAEKNNLDAPGYFAQWLIRHSTVFSVSLEGDWYDIGDKKSYEQLNQRLQK